MHHETSILNDTTFWYAVAVGAFFLFALWKLRAPVLAALDGEVAKVRDELDEARRLHADAMLALAEYRDRERGAIEEAERIVTKANEDAARLRKQAKEELRMMLERHEQLFVDRVRLAHEDALHEVRAYIIDEALSEATGKVKKMAAGDDAAKLIDAIIRDIPNLKRRKSA